MIPITILAQRFSSNYALIPFLIQPILFIGILGIFGLYFLLGFAGAVLCFLGMEFQYPLLGKWLNGYLKCGVESIDEVQEHNWVAGMCHATVVIQMWGIILPILVWAIQKNESTRLEFQAAQSALYQGIAFVVYMLWMVVYILFLFGMFFIGIVDGVFTSGSHISGSFGTALLGVFVIMFLAIMACGMLLYVLMPVYLIIALVATIRVVRGHDFKYPILGNLIARYMKTADG